jgi:hypothetical protein
MALFGMSVHANAAACLRNSACTFTAGIAAVQPNASIVDSKQTFAQRIDVPAAINGAPITAAQLHAFHIFLPKLCPNSSVHLALYANFPVKDSTGKIIDHQPGQWVGGSLQEPGLTPQQKSSGYTDPCGSGLCHPLAQGWNSFPPYIIGTVKPGPAWLAYKIDTGEPACTQVSLGARTVDAYQQPSPASNTYVFAGNWQKLPSADFLSQAAFYADFNGWSQ